jgi:hypothetical protein
VGVRVRVPKALQERVVGAQPGRCVVWCVVAALSSGWTEVRVRADALREPTHTKTNISTHYVVGWREIFHFRRSL